MLSPAANFVIDVFAWRIIWGWIAGAVSFVVFLFWMSIVAFQQSGNPTLLLIVSGVTVLLAVCMFLKFTKPLPTLEQELAPLQQPRPTFYDGKLRAFADDRPRLSHY